MEVIVQSMKRMLAVVSCCLVAHGLPGIGCAAEVVSQPALESATAGGASYVPLLSLDGGVVVFVSEAGNLVTNDDGSLFFDVFLRDLDAGVTLLVSARSPGGGGGGNNSNFPTVSPNGQFVAFESLAGDLVPNDTNGASDVFLRDVAAGTTTLISINLNSSGSARDPSWNAQMSEDATLVAFESSALGLVTNAVSGTNIFLRNIASGTTTLLSVNTNGSGRPSHSALITRSGERVLFVSAATDLVPGAVNGLDQVYAWDVAAATTEWVSRNAEALAGGPVRAFNPVVSANGQIVFFNGQTNASGPALLLRHDFGSGTTAAVSTNVNSNALAHLSFDGAVAAFESSSNVFVWHADSGATTLASADIEGFAPTEGRSYSAVLSPDGTKLAFLSDATNLVAGLSSGTVQLYLRDLNAGSTRLVSKRSDGTPSRGLSGVSPSFDGSGMLLAFHSDDPYLVPGDLNEASDAFVYSLDSDTLTLLSRRHDDVPSSTAKGLRGIPRPGSVSSNAERILFLSLDSDLAVADTNGFWDAFVRDRTLGTNILVSAGTHGVPATNQYVTEAVINPSGRWVAYATAQRSPTNSTAGALNYWDLTTGELRLLAATSVAPTGIAISPDGQLVAFQTKDRSATNDHGDQIDVYLHDLASNLHILISTNGTGVTDSLRYRQPPVFSPDGRWLLYGSNPDTSIFQLYARDLLTGATEHLSRDTNGVPLAMDSSNAVFSADSRHVAFVENSNTVHVFDFLTGTTTRLCDLCNVPSLSGDGRYAVYTRRTASDATRGIVFHDRQSGQTNLLALGSRNLHSSAPQISQNGRYVIFSSLATNLVEQDNNNNGDVFLRDTLLDQTVALSAGLGGGTANRTSGFPIMAPDGRTAIFRSFATDLVSGDFNGSADIFVVTFSTGDSDGDGLEDDWEVAYFGNLARDGSEDADLDGLTDREEFLAGTDPTDEGSVLRVITVTSAGTSATTVLWAAVAGKTYRVQYKDSANEAAWTELAVVTAATSTGSAADPSGPSADRRFYRVVLE